MSEIKELNIDNESLSSTSYEESFDEDFSEESGDDYDNNNKEFHDDDDDEDDLVIGEESKHDHTIISTISEELSNSVKDPTEISQKKDESNNQNEIFDDEYNNYYDYNDNDCNDNDDNINQELDYDCTESSSEKSGDDYNNNNNEFHDDDEDDLVIGEESKQDQTIISTISEELSNSVKDPAEISQKKAKSNNQNEIFDDEYNNYYDYNDDDRNDNNDNINQELDYDCTESSAQFSTDCPSDLNEDNYKFHFNFFQLEKIPKPNEKKYKNGTRKSLTFSNERMREIERHNQILLNKIISKGPSYENISRRDSFKKVDKIGPTARKSSAAINRSKQQRQIDYENYILKQKLEAIAKRKTKRFN